MKYVFTGFIIKSKELETLLTLTVTSM